MVKRDPVDYITWLICGFVLAFTINSMVAKAQDSTEVVATVEEPPEIVEIGSIEVVDEEGRNWLLYVETVNGQPRLEISVDVDASGVADSKMSQPLSSWYWGASRLVSKLHEKLDEILVAVQDSQPVVVPPEPNEIINLNTADFRTIVDDVKGLGEVKAGALINERDLPVYRPFSTWADLKSRVKGIGDGTVADIQAQGNVVIEPAEEVSP